MPTEEVKAVLARFDKMKSNRAVFEEHWQDIANVAMPTREFNVDFTQGTRRFDDVYDTTAARGVEKLAAALHGLLTNPATRWFALRVSEEELNERRDVQLWLHRVVTKMLELFQTRKFNFNLHAHEVYQDLVTFGMAGLSLIEHPMNLSLNARPLDELYVRSNTDDGSVEEVHRAFKMTPREAGRKFGPDNLGKTVKDAWDNPNRGKLDEPTHYVQAVFPRDFFNPEKLDPTNKPFASLVIDIENSHVVSRSGFDHMPLLTPRWKKTADEDYGRSPVMTMLPDIGMMNAMRRTNIVAGEKAVDPPLQVQADSLEGPMNTAPGSMTYVRAGVQRAIEPIHTGANVQLGDKMLELERQGISEGLHLDNLTLPEIDRMTTIEVQARMQQRMVFLSPQLSRVAAEWLGPMIRRVYGFAQKMGMLPEPPRAVRGQPMNIEYVSVMGLSQKMSEVNTVTQYFANLAPVAQFDPRVLDPIDVDEYPYWLAQAMSVPNRLLRRRETVQEMRQQQDAMQQASQEAAVAKDAADAAKSGAQAFTEALGNVA